MLGGCGGWSFDVNLLCLCVLVQALPFCGQVGWLIWFHLSGAQVFSMLVVGVLNQVCRLLINHAADKSSLGLLSS